MAIIEKPVRFGLLAAVAASLFISGPVYCGDEDTEPAYKIYIDPETGKYTTEDPDAITTPDTAVAPPQASPAKRSDLALLILSTILLVVVFVAGIIRHQRKPLF